MDMFRGVEYVPETRMIRRMTIWHVPGDIYCSICPKNKKSMEQFMNLRTFFFSMLRFLYICTVDVHWPPRGNTGFFPTLVEEPTCRRIAEIPVARRWLLVLFPTLEQRCSGGYSRPLFYILHGRSTNISRTLRCSFAILSHRDRGRATSDLCIASSRV